MEYLVCYQWNPGTAEGGNCAWGMAKSKDLVTWEDCPPALRNGTAYDRMGVFSGSIISRVIEGRRVLFLFYTSVSALPIHWSKPYIKGCETQSVAFSVDFGNSWQRYESNPLLKSPPIETVTGWRDPFVSQWPAFSELLGRSPSTDFMMVSSGERGQGPQLHIYQSHNLLEWELISTILSCEAGTKITPTSKLRWGLNFECGSFFSFGKKHYIIIGVEEDITSQNHNQRYLLWLGGDLILENGKPKLVIKSHGLLDHGITYAAHIFHDAEGRLLQLGWADEAVKKGMVLKQGWAGCLAHPRELFIISKHITQSARTDNIWDIDEKSGTMTTLGIRQAPQVSKLRKRLSSSTNSIAQIQSLTYEIEATFHSTAGIEKFIFNVRQSPDSTEATRIIFDLQACSVVIERKNSCAEKFGIDSPDSGQFHILPGEDLKIHIHVDNSIVEVYANDRFALTSRVYPSLDSAVGASYDFGDFEETKVDVQVWDHLQHAWPKRPKHHSDILELSGATGTKEMLNFIRAEVLNEALLSP